MAIVARAGTVEVQTRRAYATAHSCAPRRLPVLVPLHCVPGLSSALAAFQAFACLESHRPLAKLRTKALPNGVGYHSDDASGLNLRTS